MDLSRLFCDFLTLSVYKPLTEQPPLRHFLALLASIEKKDPLAAFDHYTDLFHALKQTGYSGLGDWLWDALRYEENPVGRLLAVGGEDPALLSAAAWEVDVLRAGAALPCSTLKAALSTLSSALPAERLPTWQEGCAFDFPALTDFYRRRGCGMFARYRAFRWEQDHLVGIPHPDSPQPHELFGYAAQRQQVLENTQALLDGRRVNHVLLYGDSGTGKSATVKSLLAHPGFENLRVIELDKDHLDGIPALVRQLEHQPQKFILFIDDLAFDQDDKAYSQLKTILEGSLERQRDNVVIYATSNRRNLVRQTFSDRMGDEVDRNETIAEKTSLAERFGVRIAYFSLTPAEFLATVRYLAEAFSLSLDPPELEKRARQWELRHPGRTPRVARQFVLHELGLQ